MNRNQWTPEQIQSRLENSCRDLQLPGEIWRDVPGYDGRYQVSNLGRCRSTVHRQGRKGKDHPFIINEPRIMLGIPDNEGYIGVLLYRDPDHADSCRLHRLVASVFVPNPNNKPTVNHIDGVKWHNWADNLEWATVAENTQHAVLSGLLRADANHLRSISHLGTAKTKKKVICIDTGEVFDSIAEAGRAEGAKDGVSLSDRIHKHKTYHGKHYEFL